MALAKKPPNGATIDAKRPYHNPKKINEFRLNVDCKIEIIQK
jgi:hypothetical protein